jgi:lysophospholipid acyltransferase (LPLAT)-like uncharacterized protein
MSFLKRITASRAFQRTVGTMGAEYLRLVWSTTRFAVEPIDFHDRVDRDFPVIMSMWHGQHYLLPFVRRARPAKVLISRHRDGEVNAIAAERLGLGTIRGSGSHSAEFNRKGGVSGFRALAAALAQGYAVSLTADVPKVARVAGQGIVRLAAVSGRPIYLVAIATSNRINLNNWDRSAVNLPFGRGAVVCADPIRVAADAGEDELEAARQAVESALNAATKRAYALVDPPRGRASA